MASLYVCVEDLRRSALIAPRSLGCPCFLPHPGAFSRAYRQLGPALWLEPRKSAGLLAGCWQHCLAVGVCVGASIALVSSRFRLEIQLHLLLMDPVIEVVLVLG